MPGVSSSYTRANDLDTMEGESVDAVEQGTRRFSQSEKDTSGDGILGTERKGLKRFWDRLRGKERKQVGILESLKNSMFSSCECLPRASLINVHNHRTAGLNILLVFIPAAWGFHFSSMSNDVSINHHITTWARR